VLAAVGELLREHGGACLVLELDAIAEEAPAGVDVHAVVVERLAALPRRMDERLALARFVRTPHELASIRAALPGVDLLAVQLHAPPEVVEARLRARDEGDELREHLAFLRAGEPADLADARIGAAGRSPRAVALDVLAAAGW
jgi:hypothetical protein